MTKVGVRSRTELARITTLTEKAEFERLR